MMEIIEEIATFATLTTGEILFGSSCLSAAISGTVLTLAPRVVPEERWPIWFGRTYAVLGTMYLVKWVLFLAPDVSWLSFLVGLSPDYLFSLGSVVTNAMLLVAARNLLHRSPSITRGTWAVAGALVGLVALEWFAGALLGADALKIAIHRVLGFADGGFSAFCLARFGQALVENLRRGSHLSPAALLAMGVAGAYSLLAVSQGTLTAVGGADGEEPSWMAWLTQVQLDASLVAIYGVSFPLKALLSVPVFTLMLARIQVLASSSRTATSASTIGRQLPAIYQLVRQTADLLRADLVEIVYRVPDSETNRVLRIALVHGELEEEVLSGLTDSISLSCIEQGKTYQTHDRNQDPFFQEHYHTTTQDMRSVVAAPIFDGTSPIGALNVEWYSPRGFGPSTVVAVETLARQAGPLVQSLRGFHALSEYSEILAQSARGNEALPDSIAEAGALAGRIIARLVSPNVVVIELTAGFGAPHLSVDGVRADPAQRPTMKPLFEERLNACGIELGTLSVYPAPGQDRHLSHYPAVLRLLAERAADTVRDAAQEIASRRLARFQIDAAKVKTVEELFEVAAAAAKRGGLSWLVVDPVPGGGSWSKEPKELEGVTEITVSRRLAEGATAIAVHSMTEQVNGASTLLELPLAGIGIRIWLAVPNSRFGPELRGATPWHMFLDRFADLTAATLQPILGRREVEAAMFEAAQTQGLATIAAMTGTLVHQIANLTRDLSFGAKTLNDAFVGGQIQCADSRLQNILTKTSRSARTLDTLCEGILSITRLDQDRPSDLKSAIQQSHRILAASAHQFEIEIRVPEGLGDGTGPWLIDVPFFVSTLAIANIVSNARDALRAKEGKRWIELAVTILETTVECRIEDNGPGVPVALRQTMFMMGTTSKHTGGWGLYLTKKTLGEHQSEVKLLHTGDTGTAFLLTFPRPNTPKPRNR